MLLADQDRTRWNRDLIAEGQSLLRECLRRNAPGPYQLQAAINAVHADAPTAAATDWPQILTLYTHLHTLTPTPIVALHRTVALAEVHGPTAALRELATIDLPNHHRFHAIRADLLRRTGNLAEAAAAYDAAIALTSNEVEREYLRRRKNELTAT